MNMDTKVKPKNATLKRLVAQKSKDQDALLKWTQEAQAQNKVIVMSEEQENVMKRRASVMLANTLQSSGCLKEMVINQKSKNADELPHRSYSDITCAIERK